MGTIYGDSRFRKNPSPANIPDGQTQLGDSPEKQNFDGLDGEKSEKIRQMISSSRPDEINIVCLNAGQGDATIVRLPNGKLMVIDCNIENAPDNIVDVLKSAGIKEIDYLVITHPHQDHMSGIGDIANNFEVGEVWTADFKRKKNNETPESYEAYLKYVSSLKKLEKNGAVIKTPVALNEPIVKDGTLEISVFGPSTSIQGNNEDIHEESLVVHIKSGKTTALFPGDTTNHQLDRISKYYPINGTTFLHAPHHGSKEGANKDVIEQISPRHTVVSVAKENPHGLPNADAMKVYRQTTDDRNVHMTNKGTIGIRFNSNGESVEIQE